MTVKCLLGSGRLNWKLVFRYCHRNFLHWDFKGIILWSTGLSYEILKTSYMPWHSCTLVSPNLFDYSWKKILIRNLHCWWFKKLCQNAKGFLKAQMWVVITAYQPLWNGTLECSCEVYYFDLDIVELSNKNASKLNIRDCLSITTL